MYFVFFYGLLFGIGIRLCYEHIDKVYDYIKYNWNDLNKPKAHSLYYQSQSLLVCKSFIGYVGELTLFFVGYYQACPNSKSHYFQHFLPYLSPKGQPVEDFLICRLYSHSTSLIFSLNSCLAPISFKVSHFLPMGCMTFYIKWPIFYVDFLYKLHEEFLLFFIYSSHNSSI